MSIRTLLWAKDQTVITQSIRSKDGQPVHSAPAPSALDKLVLIAIGDEASENTWDALLGTEDIAVFAGCTRRAVRESLRRLERAGYIRCRPTRIESGHSGWQRIYLLSTDSPLVKGLIEVDFTTVEDISRYQMRTFRDREQTNYAPSDSPTKKPAHQQEEHGSAPDTGRNMVPPLGRNMVPPGEEHGSAPREEHGSAPSFSTNSSSPSDARARSRGSNAKEGKRKEKEEKKNENANPDEPSTWALQLVTSLDYGQHRRPTQKQAHKLAGLIDDARKTGLTETEVKRHCRATINAAMKSGVAYLVGGLRPENLPMPSTDMPFSQEQDNLPRTSTGTVPSRIADLSAEDLIAEGMDPKFLPRSLRESIV